MLLLEPQFAHLPPTFGRARPCLQESVRGRTWRALASCSGGGLPPGGDGLECRLGACDCLSPSLSSLPPSPFSLQRRLTMWRLPSLKKTRVWT